MKKKGIFLTIILIFINISFLSAEQVWKEPKKQYVSLGALVKYNLKQNLNYGGGLTYNYGAFDLNFDIASDLDKHLSFGFYLGGSPFIKDFNEGKLRLSLLAGLDFDFSPTSFKSFYVFQPMGRCNLSWRFPFALELKAGFDLGYAINVANRARDGFNLKAGLYVSYSFDVTNAKKPEVYISPYDKVYNGEFSKINKKGIDLENSLTENDKKFLEDLDRKIDEDKSISGKYLLSIHREMEDYKKAAEFYKEQAETETVRYIAVDSALFGGKSSESTTDKSSIINDNREKSIDSITGNHNFNGAIARYIYDRAKIYDVFLSPRNVTDIRLEEGENVVSIVLGDPVNWVSDTLTTTEDGEQISHILFRPSNTNIQTDCMVATDVRVYYFKLYSTQSTYMTALEFKYPYKDSKGLLKGVISNNLNSTDEINKQVSDLIFNYKIEGDVSWLPKKVYSDGERTYIQFDNSFLTNNITPVVYLRDNNTDSLVNFSVKGITYTVPIVIAANQKLLLLYNNEICLISRDE